MLARRLLPATGSSLPHIRLALRHILFLKRPQFFLGGGALLTPPPPPAVENPTSHGTWALLQPTESPATGTHRQVRHRPPLPHRTPPPPWSRAPEHPAAADTSAASVTSVPLQFRGSLMACGSVAAAVGVGLGPVCRGPWDHLGNDQRRRSHTATRGETQPPEGRQVGGSNRVPFKGGGGGWGGLPPPPFRVPRF